MERLSWPLDKLKNPSFGRQTFQQELVRKPNKVANDDVVCRASARVCGTIKTESVGQITMNTQSSSQWDGLRHFAYQKVGLDSPREGSC